MTSANNNILQLEMDEIKILKQTSIPPIFAQFLKEKSLSLGVAFALRVNATSSQRYLMPAAPKPISVKAKTGNWSFTKGIIAVQPELGKIIQEDDEWNIVERKQTEIPSNLKFLKTTIHKLSLQEILLGMDAGEYILLNSETEIKKSGRIHLKSKIQPSGRSIIFSINFLEDKSRIEKQCAIELEKILLTIPLQISQPEWWNHKWGNFKECLNTYYPAQYKYANDPQFSDILAYGISDEKQNVLPITGDQDFLWISSPCKKYDALLKDFSETINTLESGGIEKLYKARIDLHIKLGGSPEDAHQSISNSSISGLGCVTAYESYVIDEVNKAFSTCGVKHIRNLIQHAAENHNPNEPSPLDEPIIHVWNGKIYLTNNEQELIDFFMQPDYPKENHIDIHPEWDMKKWAPVILMQLILKQPIPKKTLVTYKKYRQDNQKFKFLGNDPLQHIIDKKDIENG